MSINVASQKRPSIVADLPFCQVKAAVRPIAWIVTHSAIRHQAMTSFRKHEAGGRRSSVAELSAS